MDKYKEIRPIVLGVAIKDNKLLVEEGIDTKKNEIFYRCLGGGIEFLEKSEDALEREFMEELNIHIDVGKFLGLSENIFEYNGKKAHELVFFYEIIISDDDYKTEYTIIDNDRTFTAKWINIEDFKSGKYILYPKEIFKYI